MSGMEPEVKAFLKKVLLSLFIGLFWMTANMIFGIFFGWLFFGDHLSLGNILCYIFLIGSLVWLVRFYLRLWKQPPQV